MTKARRSALVVPRQLICISSPSHQAILCAIEEGVCAKLKPWFAERRAFWQLPLENQSGESTAYMS